MGVGQQYLFSTDVEVSGTLPLVTVGGVAVPLMAGSPFVVGVDTWTPETGLFTATSTSEVLSIANQQRGEEVDFVDNISVIGPEPGTVTLLVIALAGIGSLRCLKRVRLSS